MSALEFGQIIILLHQHHPISLLPISTESHLSSPITPILPAVASPLPKEWKNMSQISSDTKIDPNHLYPVDCPSKKTPKMMRISAIDQLNSISLFLSSLKCPSPASPGNDLMVFKYIHLSATNKLFLFFIDCF